MEKIEPAMTAEEWAKKERWPASIDEAGNMEIGLSEWVYDEPGTDEYEVEIGRIIDGKDRHALAALALDGQPYGFTWEDVDALRAEWEEEWSGVSKPNNGDPLISIADRIAALLPPRDA